MVIEKNEEKLVTEKAYTDDNKEVGLGICFGTGIGIILGAIVGNVILGLSAGGVMGILISLAVRLYKKVIYERVHI